MIILYALTVLYMHCRYGDSRTVVTLNISSLIYFMDVQTYRKKLNATFAPDGLDHISKLVILSAHAVSVAIMILLNATYTSEKVEEVGIILGPGFWTTMFFVWCFMRMPTVLNRDKEGKAATEWILLCVTAISTILTPQVLFGLYPDIFSTTISGLFIGTAFSRFIYEDILYHQCRVLRRVAFFHNAMDQWTYGGTKKVVLTRPIPEKSLPKAKPGAYFEYDALDATRANDVIRVLKILPSKNSSNQIHAEIVQISVSNQQCSYEALSYTWGGQKADKVIWCNGKRMLVTENLSQALSRIRFPDKPRFVWVDAVCINQADNEEKKHQVQMMKNIYKGARAVIIWLGGDNGNSHSAILLLQRMVKIWKQHRSMAKSVDGVVGDSGDSVIELFQRDRTRLGLPPSHDPSYNALEDFFARPYFGRVWIIQEVVMARETEVLCGSSPISLSWDDLTAVLKFMPQLAGYSASFPSAFELGNMIERTRTAVANNDSEALELSKLLSRYNCFQATEAKDNIIGLMGIANDNLGIEVNYGADTSAFLWSTAVKLLGRDGNLDILGDIDHEVASIGKAATGTDFMPSWVPRWQTSRALVINTSKTTRLADYGEFRCCGAHGSWSKTGGEELVKTLEVQGHLLDTIGSVGTVMAGSGDLPGRDEVYDDWEGLVVGNAKSWTSTYGPTGETVDQAYWQTIHFGLKTPRSHWESHPLYRRVINIARLWKRSWRMQVLTLPLELLASICLSSLDQLARVFPFLGSEQFMFLRRMHSQGNMAQRRLFRRRIVLTREHGYMGLAPVAAEAGDQVALLKGSRVPVVIRKHGEEWLVVGDCYLHGAMQGEAFEVKRCRTFVLA